MLQHQALVTLPVISELHGICSRLWHTHHPAHANAAIPQALQRAEMLLLLVALCLTQGLGGAVPHAGASHGNPERFMNIVSAGGGKPTPCGTWASPGSVPKVFPEGPDGLSPSLTLASAPGVSRGWGARGTKSFLYLHGCHSLHDLSLVFL